MKKNDMLEFFHLAAIKIEFRYECETKHLTQAKHLGQNKLERYLNEGP